MKKSDSSDTCPGSVGVGVSNCSQSEISICCQWLAKQSSVLSTASPRNHSNAPTQSLTTSICCRWLVSQSWSSNSFGSEDAMCAMLLSQRTILIFTVETHASLDWRILPVKMIGEKWQVRISPSGINVTQANWSSGKMQQICIAVAGGGTWDRCAFLLVRIANATWLSLSDPLDSHGTMSRPLDSYGPRHGGRCGRAWASRQVLSSIWLKPHAPTWS